MVKCKQLSSQGSHFSTVYSITSYFGAFVLGLCLTSVLGSYIQDMQNQLTSFLEKNTTLFMKELWTMLISAQEAEDGVPLQLIRQKEQEVSCQEDISLSPILCAKAKPCTGFIQWCCDQEAQRKVRRGVPAPFTCSHGSTATSYHHLPVVYRLSLAFPGG